MTWVGPTTVFAVLDNEVPWTTAIHISAGLEAAALILILGLTATAIYAYKKEDYSECSFMVAVSLVFAMVAVIVGPIAWVILPVTAVIIAIISVFASTKVRAFINNMVTAPFKKIVELKKKRKMFPPGFDKSA